MLDKVSDGFRIAVKRLRGWGAITESNIKDVVKEIRRVLIQADVDYKIAKDFANEIKEKSLGRDILKNLSPRELFVKIVHEEIVLLLGSKNDGLFISGNLSVLMLVGLQGVGKTTLSVKLANYIRSRYNKSVIIAACDVYRPAAIDQLKIFAESADIEVYSEQNTKNVLDIAKNAVINAKLNNKQVVIIDTAGRVSVDLEMMDEILKLKEVLIPSEILFVVDSMTGQDALTAATAFDERIKFDSVVLSKFDSDTRGGVALSISKVLGKPIKFVSVGEKVEDFEPFYPDRMANRILGMGDVVSLVEKVESIFSKEQVIKLEKKIKSKKLNFFDFLEQIETIKKLGNIKNIMKMVPGFSQMLNDSASSIDENIFDQARAIIQSMTNYERSNPSVLDKSRINRISRGAGLTTVCVSSFLKKFESIQANINSISSRRIFLDLLNKKKY